LCIRIPPELLKKAADTCNRGRDDANLKTSIDMSADNGYDSPWTKIPQLCKNLGIPVPELVAEDRPVPPGDHNIVASELRGEVNTGPEGEVASGPRRVADEVIKQGGPWGSTDTEESEEEGEPSVAGQRKKLSKKKQGEVSSGPRWVADEVIKHELEWLDGVTNMSQITNAIMLRLLDRNSVQLKAKMVLVVINLLGIKAEWVDWALKRRFDGYMVRSMANRKLLEAKPEARWEYLDRLLPRGDLHRPELFLSRPLGSKVSHLLHSVLAEHGKEHQMCQNCGRWGDHKMCFCMKVFYCTDTDCWQKDQLQHAADCRKHQQLNSLALLSPVDMIQNEQEKKELLKMTLQRTRLLLARQRRVRKIVPAGRKVTLPLASHQRAVAMTKIKHKGNLALFKGTVEVASVPPSGSTASKQVGATVIHRRRRRVVVKDPSLMISSS
jgi:hypothetical protein